MRDSSAAGGRSSSLMENLLGLLRIRVKRGVNLAVRDVCSSDPYVVIKMAKQKLKTRVIKKDVNPEWNEDLTLSVSDPNLPIKLTVYDHDTFTKDDKMGDAEFDIRAYIDALRMKLKDLPINTRELHNMERRQAGPRSLPQIEKCGTRGSGNPIAMD